MDDNIINPNLPKVGFLLSDNVLKPQHDNFVSVKHILLNSKTARSNGTIEKNNHYFKRHVVLK